jgi:small-conductance mechanosensitive channel
VENASLSDPAVLASSVVQVAYGTDVLALRPKLLAALAQIARISNSADRQPAVHLTAFAADGLELTVWYWSCDPENGQSNLRSEVNLAILSVLDAEGVEIPYPQRVLRWTAGPSPLPTVDPDPDPESR